MKSELFAPHACLSSDRRAPGARECLLARIRDEFDEMPGTRLTPAQARRLFNIPSEHSDRILTQLVERGLLQLSRDGCYRRPFMAA